METTNATNRHLPLFLCIIHIAIRISLSNRAPITDCDEVYNYWEPLHFLNYGSGMQTWEYAPQYALRTYAYLLPMSLLSNFYEKMFPYCPVSVLNQVSRLISPNITSTFGFTTFTQNKVLVFHLLRASISTITSIAELHLIHSLSTYYSIYVAIYTWILLLTSTGMFHTAPAYLPSATVMLCMFFSLSYQIQAWYYYNFNNNIKDNDDHKYNKMESSFHKAIISGLIAILMTGWPFCAILFIPLGLYSTFTTYYTNNHGNLPTIQRIKYILHLFQSVITYLIIIQLIVMIVDYKYYEKIISPTINIFIYNTGLFSNKNGDGSGIINRDELYGVEDVSYYIKNLILNWNVTGILGVLALPFLIILQLLSNNNNRHWKKNEIQIIVLMLLPMMLWIVMVFTRPHKEERFLFPIYPMLAIGAAMVIDKVLDLTNIHILFSNVYQGKGFSRIISFDEEWKKVTHRIKILGGFCLLLPKVLFSISRSMVLYDGYTSPLNLYTHLHHHIISERIRTNTSINNVNEPILVCTGGEWYRYPSSYHLPDVSRLAFLKSSFGGQLPQQFSKYGSKEESLLIQSGHFNDMNQEETDRYVDISQCSYVIGLLDDSDLSNYMKIDDRQWTEIATYKFLDADKTSLLHRVLYLPFKRKATYQSYVLFKSQ